MRLVNMRLGRAEVMALLKLGWTIHEGENGSLYLSHARLDGRDYPIDGRAAAAIKRQGWYQRAYRTTKS